MNNLTQTQQGAKDALLQKQQSQMLEHYKTISAKEQAAIIRQINGFLPVTHSESEKAFWIGFRDKLELIE